MESNITEKGTEGTSGEEILEEELPAGGRQCRDVAFLILFAIYIVGLLVVLWRATLLGNPYRIIYGTDSWGNVCNQRNDVIEGVAKTRTGLNLEGRRYLFYFNDDIFRLLPSSPTESRSIKICVTSCPTTEITTVSQMIDMASSMTSEHLSLCVYDVPHAAYFSGSTSGLGDCPPLPVHAQTPVLHRCMPSGQKMTSSPIFDVIGSLLDHLHDNFLQKSVSDLKKAWLEVACLAASSVVLSVLITVMLQFLVRIIIWLIIVTMVIGFVSVTGLCWFKYHDARTFPGRGNAHTWLLGAISASVITVVILLVLFILRKHIKLVVQLFREAGRAVSKMPLLLVMPFLTVVILTTIVAAFFWVFLYAETAGVQSVDKMTGFVQMHEDPYMHYMKWYHLVGLVWTVQFILACHRMVVSGAVSAWYFTRDHSTLSRPISQSASRLIRYHLGSMALGSLIITFVIIVRAILAFIQNRLRGSRNPVALILLKCLCCCMCCFERFLQFINTNAYIEIGIYGCSFCTGARKAFRIIVDYAIQLTAISSVGDFVLFLGKMVVVAIISVSGVQIFSIQDDINLPWLPVAIVAVFAFLVASAFISVYETIIDTIFLCYCEDIAINDGLDRPYYMSVGLRKCMAHRPAAAVSNKVSPLT